MSRTHGRFFWYELMTTDPKAAVDFYKDIVGWTSTTMGEEYGGYVVVEAEGEAKRLGVGGIGGMPPGAPAGAPPQWSGYIEVDDVDAMADRIVKAGGTLRMGPMDIPKVGRFAAMADPQGAGFNIMTPAPMDTPNSGGPPYDVTPETVGYCGWHELLATDWETAFAFYAEMFGWTKADALNMGEMGTYQMFSDGHKVAGGMMSKPAHVPVCYWGYYFQVPSVTAAADRAKAMGASLFFGPMAVPSGASWIVQGKDPQGAVFSLVSPRP